MRVKDRQSGRDNSARKVWRDSDSKLLTVCKPTGITNYKNSHCSIYQFANCNILATLLTILKQKQHRGRLHADIYVHIYLDVLYVRQ